MPIYIKYRWKHYTNNVSSDTLHSQRRYILIDFNKSTSFTASTSRSKGLITITYYACYLLSSTTMNIDDIAIEIGYTGRAYFTRIFEKIMHVTPAKYRISPSKTINLEDRLVNYLYFPVKSQI